MSEATAEKKHKPTPRRRQQAREEGRVASSRDLTSAVLLLVAIGALWLLGGHAVEHLASMITDGIGSPSIEPLTAEDASNWMLQSAARLAIVVVPIMLAIATMGVLISITQTGFLITPSRIAPSFDNIDPLSGGKKILSLPAMARLGFGVLKVATVVIVSYAAAQHFGTRAMNMSGMEIQQISRTLFESLIGTCCWIGAALFVLAVMDFGFQKWKLERDLMMTDEELREELRETEGDPVITDRRRQTQQRYRHRSPHSTANSALGSADVIITDGSSVAVAIKYNPMTMAAPVVVAKGHGDEVATMQQSATRRGIPVTHHPLLATHQYRNTSIGNEISADQYRAVAQILRESPRVAA